MTQRARACSPGWELLSLTPGPPLPRTQAPIPPRTQQGCCCRAAVWILSPPEQLQTVPERTEVDLLAAQSLQAFYYQHHGTSFKHYFYLYLNRSKYANSFYKFYETDRRGSSLFIPLDYEWILLNILKPNHIFILCHVTSCPSFVLGPSPLSKQLCNTKHCCVPQNIFLDECSKHILKALLILV